MRKFVSLAAGVGLALAATVSIAPERAEAHIWDNYSHYYCAKHRSSTAMTITHAVPYTLQPGMVGYYCREDFFGNGYQYWVHVSPPYSDVSWVPYGRDHCQPQGWSACNAEP